MIHFYSNGGTTPKDPSVLPPPADDLLREADVTSRNTSCQVVTRAEARQIDAELTAAFGNSDFIPYGFIGTPVTIRGLAPHMTGCTGY